MKRWSIYSFVSIVFSFQTEDDEGKLYKFQLSDEIISKLFDSGEIL